MTSTAATANGEGNWRKSLGKAGGSSGALAGTSTRRPAAGSLLLGGGDESGFSTSSCATAIVRPLSSSTAPNAEPRAGSERGSLTRVSSSRRSVDALRFAFIDLDDTLTFSYGGSSSSRSDACSTAIDCRPAGAVWRRGPESCGEKGGVGAVCRNGDCDSDSGEVTFDDVDFAEPVVRELRLVVVVLVVLVLVLVVVLLVLEEVLRAVCVRTVFEASIAAA